MKIGTTDIKDMFLGTIEVKKIFSGTTLLYEKVLPPSTALFYGGCNNHCHKGRFR